MFSFRTNRENLLIGSSPAPFGPTTKDGTSVTLEPLREGLFHSAMLLSVVFPLMSAFVFATCQQPLDDLSEISPYQPSGNLEKRLLQQCESFAQTLSEENERLKGEMRVLKAKVEALEEVTEEEDEEEEDGSDESKEPSRSLRSRRAAGCEGGTLAAWACAPQCVFKLKGLCGLSLKSICHC